MTLRRVEPQHRLPRVAVPAWMRARVVALVEEIGARPAKAWLGVGVVVMLELRSTEGMLTREVLGRLSRRLRGQL